MRSSTLIASCLLRLAIAVLLASCLLSGRLLLAADLPTISQDIVRNIESAQAELSRVERDISMQRQALATRLNAAQNSVSALREQVVAARRLADEQTLSLSQLEERLADWREQSVYQSGLLATFAKLSQAPVAANDSAGDFTRTLAWLEQFIERQRDLRPAWEEREVLLADGRLQELATLQLGPVAWYWREGEGGLLDLSATTARAALPFRGAALAELGRLYLHGQGEPAFDPTLSRALLLAEEEGLLTHLRKGGIWAVPILLFGLFACAVALFKALSLWRLPTLLPALPARVEALAGAGDAELRGLRAQLQGAQADLFDISRQAQSAEQCDERLFACLLSHKRGLESWLGAIAVTAAVAPLLGLLGTVSGMIGTFQMLTLFGAGDPAVVSGGISEALITTELGLVVAIPALLAHALMSRRVKAYYGHLETDAIQLSQLRPGVLRA